MPSRQANYRRRMRPLWRAAGRCWECGREADGKRRCPRHQEMHNARKRKRALPTVDLQAVGGG